MPPICLSMPSFTLVLCFLRATSQTTSCFSTVEWSKCSLCICVTLVVNGSGAATVFVCAWGMHVHMWRARLTNYWTDNIPSYLSFQSDATDGDGCALEYSQLFEYVFVVGLKEGNVLVVCCFRKALPRHNVHECKPLCLFPALQIDPKKFRLKSPTNFLPR